MSDPIGWPPRPPQQQCQMDWPGIGCVLCAIGTWVLVWALMRTGERMVDAVLSIQWPI